MAANDALVIVGALFGIIQCLVIFILVGLRTSIHRLADSMAPMPPKIAAHEVKIEALERAFYAK